MQFDDLSRLSPWAQKQILAKLQAAEQGKTKRQQQKTAKYHNEKVQMANLKFDSKKEARRYQVLAAMLERGEISDLRLQVNFTLQEGFTCPDGERIRPIVYKADFTYYRNQVLVVEDVKSSATRTKVYLIKKKLMKEKYGIEIKEV